MKTTNSRHDLSYLKAKQETNFLYSSRESNESKLKEGFIGGGYFATLSATEPVYKAIKLFIKANNRRHAFERLNTFPDAYYFVEENPNCVVSICGAGLQHPARAEGLIHEQKEN